MNAGHIRSVLPKLKPIGYKVLLDIIVNSPGIATAEIPYSFSLRYKGDSKTDVRTVADFLEYILEVTAGRYISMKFMKYMLVGGTGVFVNFLFFWFCFDVLNAAFTASLIAAIEISITTNYFLNDIWTFRLSSKRSGPNVPGWLKYNVVCLSGSAINYAVSALQYSSGHQWMPSVLFGIIIASLWNYVISKNYVWQ